MAIAQITDHVDQALARLPNQFKSRVKYEALISALTTPAQALENALWQLLTERQVDTAVGVQLDAIGKLVGQLRGGLSDDDYRRYVAARIRANRSKGTAKDILEVVSLVLDDDTAVIQLDPQPPAAIVVRILEFLVDQDLLADVLLSDVLIDFLRDTSAAGVRTILEYQTVADATSLMFPPFTVTTGTNSSGATTLNVADTSSFPEFGTLQINHSAGNEVTYTGKTATSFLDVDPLPATYSAGSVVVAFDGTGLGLGDSTNAATGGKFAGAKE